MTDRSIAQRQMAEGSVTEKQLEKVELLNEARKLANEMPCGV